MADGQEVDEFRPVPIEPGFPKSGETYSSPIAQCKDCKHFCVSFLYPRPPTLDTRLSSLVRDDDIYRIRCTKGRFRYADGKVKEYRSRHIIRQDLNDPNNCVDFDPVDEDYFAEEVRNLIDFVLETK